MKKATLALSLLMALGIGAGTAKAQTVDSLPHHNLGHLSEGQSHHIMEMPDGSLLGCIGIEYWSESGGSLGKALLLQKVSRRETPMDITDSVFTPTTLLPWSLSARDPQGDGCVFAEFYNDYDSGACFLKIRHFDDHLNFDTAEVVLPIAHSLRTGTNPKLDPNGDIVLAYYDYYSSPLEVTFARIGLDGTVKYQKTDTLMAKAGDLMGPVVFTESPLTYCCWSSYLNSSHTHQYLNCYLLDSLFNVTGFYALPDASGPPDHVDYLCNALTARLLGLDDGCFMAAITYNRDPNAIPHVEDDGVVVMKYDKDFNLLSRRKFLTEPYLQTSHFGARSIGLERSHDGYVYFAYFTHGIGHESQVCVVKMDEDLNVIWQRHCLSLESWSFRYFGRMTVLDDNSVAVMGNTYYYNGDFANPDHSEVFYLIVHDDYDALEEQGFAIRPYAFYPNPVQSELHLQYSPDVQPARIELYDLQGRLLQTRTQGLESIGLEGLAAGQYLMKVTLQDGKTFTDKVVKE